MTYLVALGTAVPAYAYPQETILNFMEGLIPLSLSERKRLAKMYAHSGIRTRHSVLPDYNCEPEQRRLFPPSADLEPFPGISERMACFQREVLPLARQAVEDCFSNAPHMAIEHITHLIAVTCTGISAPGLDLMLMRELKLPTSVQRTAVHFMGCYAALHALKIADAICRSQTDAVVLLVCAELCTLYFQKKPTPDNLTANLLFADGAAAALLTSRRPSTAHLQLEGFASEVMLAGWDDMAWNISESGFLMRLSGEVPTYLRLAINPLIDRILTDLNLQPEEIQHWAIHPGGRKILDLIEQALNLPVLQASRDILSEYGNMSSPTILFVLKRIWQHDWLPARVQRILAAAFGPGLTLETALFRGEG